MEHIGLERKLAATVPDVAEQPALRGYMLGRPHGRSDSGWPVEDGESRWDPDENIVRLRHTEADKKQGHRAFFPETLEVTKGLLLRYVATYTPKFSDSFAREWLNDEASAFSVARRVLFDYQPAEPEMWLYLYAQQMPPCRYGGPMVPLIAPWPGMEMACDTVSLFNDRWFGQWLALRQPFRKLSDLLLNDVVEKVPSQYVHFANAALQCPDYWEDEERIRADLELEAVGNDKIQTFMAKVKAQRSLVERFLRGVLTKEDEAGTTEALREVGLLPNEEDPLFRDVRFNQMQERLERGICKLLDVAKAARDAANEVEWERIVEEAKAVSRPQAVIGPPGTGKTTVVDKCVRRCIRHGGRVLYALPTAH